MEQQRLTKNLLIITASALVLLLAGCLEETTRDLDAGTIAGSDNSPPAIRGNPSTGVTVGQVYSSPETNTDGTPFTDLSGFRIYYGMTSGHYPNGVNIDNPGVSTFVVDNLAPATYFFVATAVNSVGIESGFSNEVTRDVV